MKRKKRKRRFKRAAIKSRDHTRVAKEIMVSG